MRVILRNKYLVDDAPEVAAILHLIFDILCALPRGSNIMLSSSGIFGLTNILSLSSSIIEDLLDKVPNPTAEELLADVAELRQKKERPMSGSDMKGQRGGVQS
jgi:hypothetical protein